jgi:hypothetical protein
LKSLRPNVVPKVLNFGQRPMPLFIRRTGTLARQRQQRSERQRAVDQRQQHDASVGVTMPNLTPSTIATGIIALGIADNLPPPYAADH